MVMPIPSVWGLRALHDGMAWKEYTMTLRTAVIELTCVATDVVRLLRAPQSEEDSRHMRQNYSY